MTNRSSLRRRHRSSLFGKKPLKRDSRKASRHVQVEPLEKRELLAAEVVAHGSFAVGTSEEVMERWETQLEGQSEDGNAANASAQAGTSVGNLLVGSRWESTAFGTNLSPNNGDPTRVTWGFAPDGTDIVNPGTGAVEGQSDVVAFLDAAYGGTNEPIISNKPWFPVFVRTYEDLSRDTGLEFVYEPNDDGVPVAINSPVLVGELGVRADLRISGRPLDGNFGLLAFNYFPNNGGRSGADGDMVIDTTDNWITVRGQDNDSLGWQNLIGHEVGHGIGLAHTEPLNQTKLMEPQIHRATRGAQEDDKHSIHTLYGDQFEPNDTTTAAHDLGVLRDQTAELFNVSIDENTDTDVFRFETLLATELTISLEPKGTSYLVGPQNGTPSQVNRLTESNLGFRVIDTNGTELVRVDDTAAGGDEILNKFSLPRGGEYFVEVFGSDAGTQIYDIDIQVGDAFTFAADDGQLRLVSVSPSPDRNFDRDGANIERTAPNELKLRFSGDSVIDETTLADGIRFSRAANDDTRDTGDDVEIVPGYLGFDQNERVVVARFAEPLPDDLYRVEVFGEDVPADVGSPLRAANGAAFQPLENGTFRDVIDFELELSAKVLAVVPQPVDRNDATGELDQRRDEIEVYFDDDDLFVSEDPNDPGTATLKRPEFYQLIRTNNTATTSDDLVFLPNSVRVERTIDQDIANLNGAGSSTTEVTVNRVVLTFDDDLALLGREGAFRLKVGSSAPVRVQGDAARILQIESGDETVDVGNTAGAAFQLGDLGTTSTLLLSGGINGTGSPFDYPGANGEPGTRDIGEESHVEGVDTTAGIQTRFFNFALDRSYGFSSTGSPLFTSINELQKERVREIYEIWSARMGVQFVETVDRGTTVVVGDTAPNGVVSGPGGVAGVASSALAIMDSAENWNNLFGQSFFNVALHEIGHSIGLGHSYDLDDGSTMGIGISDFDYPGEHDIVHGQHLYRPDNKDVDFYAFNVQPGDSGIINAETVAERSINGSLLDTHLSLFKRVDGHITLVAANDDSFGTDSAIEFQVDEGEYFLAVTGKGNEGLDPTIEGSGGGAGTEGRYELQVKFTSNNASIVDAAGSSLDGDADGIAGGDFNFWFHADQESEVLFVDAAAAPGGDGSAATPFREIDTALVAANAAAQAVPRQKVTVRIVGNDGADDLVGFPEGDFRGADDNLAYEVGRIESLGRTLDDGRNLVVPAGVNVMIDAGSIFKMQASRIVVGSEDSGTDASEGSLQVLGTPHLPVFFTSYNDPGVGLERSELEIDPAAGDWGGILLRNDVDRAQGRVDLERDGIFINNITGADVRFGGGVVNVNGNLTSIAPIQLDASRPLLVNNSITENASAAISADPSSFEETNFNTPFYQRGDRYTPDYSRVGPIMYGNEVTDNSINGVLVRIDTLAGNEKEALTVSSRFDDTELVHVLGDSLIINGNPSGTTFQDPATAPTLTTLEATSTPNGSTGLDAGDYEYAISFIDPFGGETAHSELTRTVTIAQGQSTLIEDIPAATERYVSRRLYRRAAGSNDPLLLVADLDRTTPDFVDSVAAGSIAAISSLPSADAPTTTVTNTPPGQGGLFGFDYQYVMTFVDANGDESAPSEATEIITVPQGQSVLVSDLAPAVAQYVSRRLYRRFDFPNFDYQLVAELDATSTQHVDSVFIGTTPLETTEQYLASPDARLVVDPGVTIKSDGVRIETGFGGDLIAEGLPGKPVIFTSRFDDRFGAGGTFDTGNDGVTDGITGQWSGIYAAPTSRLSLDHARIAFGGGISPIGGSSSGFNALQIYQADARVANTIFESNASGTTGSVNARAGLAPNSSAVIHVNGSEPILVGNTFFDNSAGNVAAISVNVNDLNAQIVEDFGRQTGSADRVSSDGGNQGAFIRGNLLTESGIAGLVVRGGLLSTEGVWDDTDIVHVVDGSVTDTNQHTFGGLRLESRVDESLVVKFLDNSGTLRATGELLDIQTRIGGTIHVIGQPDFPVVLTTIDDDTVGGGFTPDGRPLTDTGSDGASTPLPGSWNGIELLSLSNDRNVETIVERETVVGVGVDRNGTPVTAQVLGELATREYASDETLRLGYVIHGSVSASGDQDVYSFRGTAGTEVWLDIDRTASTLDSQIELISEDGLSILAASDNSITESATGSVLIDGGIALPMQRSLFADTNSNGTPKDLYTTNTLDAGMRVTLPGNAGTSREYFIRVRGNDQTEGIYQLQIRLQETDEEAGSTVRHSEIRYAQTGIETRGLPFHSPLTGETSLANNLANPITLDVGELGSTDRGTISIAGNLTAENAIDTYAFTLDRQQIQQIGQLLDDGDVPSISATFDIDYADAFGRPNTTLLLYSVDEDGNRTLIGYAGDSNIAADQASPLAGTDLTDLSRGSAGVQDAFLGTVELQAGSYEIVVVNNRTMPTDLDLLVNQAAANNDVRIEPIDSVDRIAEDRFDTLTTQVTANTPGNLFNADPSQNVIPFSLGDVDLIALEGDRLNNGNTSRLNSLNAVTGDTNGWYDAGQASVAEIISRNNGDLLGFAGLTTARSTDANLSTTYTWDVDGQTLTPVGDTGLDTNEGTVDAAGNVTTRTATTTGTNAQNGNGMLVTAVAELNPSSNNPFMYVVARRGDFSNNYVGVIVDADDDAVVTQVYPSNNYIYRVDPDTGAVINATANGQGRQGDAVATGAGSSQIEVGRILSTPGDDIVGLAIIEGVFWAISQNGVVVQIDGNQIGNNPTPTGLNTIGQFHQNLGITNIVSATPMPNSIPGAEGMILIGDAAGNLYAYNPATQELPNILSRSSSTVASDAQSLRSLTFSRFEENLWHTTNRAQQKPAGDPGQKDGTSFYFGNETNTPNENTYSTGSTSHGQIETDGFDLTDYDAEDEPVLYFDYFLNTEDAEAFLNANNGFTRDSFRVFVSSLDQPSWRLAVTNNGSQTGTFNDPTDPTAQDTTYDEFDVGVSGYRDENGVGYLTREAFDSTDWSQSRVELAPWAGQRDVRIRIDFNTAGESERFVSDLQIPSADFILDSSDTDRTFTLEHTRSGDQVSFQYDLGLVLQAPAGGAIADGDTFTIDATTYTFQLASSVDPLVITFDPDMTASEIATLMQASISGGFFTATDPNHTSRFGVQGTTSFNATSTLMNAMVLETPGATGGSAPIAINIDDSVADVQLATQQAIADGFFQGVGTADVAPYQLVRDLIRMHGLHVVDGGALRFFQNDTSSALTLFEDVFAVRSEGTLPGQEAGVYPRGNEFGNIPIVGGRTRAESILLKQGERARLNLAEGVYLDDFIVGFAERGETVRNATPNPSGAPVATQVNPYHEATTAFGGLPVEQVEAGEYQLNIRLSAEYGLIQVDSTPPPAQRGFNTNDIIGESVVFDFGVNAPMNGGEIPDGSTIQLSDGTKVLTFEFENIDANPNDAESGDGVAPGNVAIPFTSDMTAEEIAATFRDTVNSPVVQNDFNVFATSFDGSVDSLTQRSVHLHGPAAADLLGGQNFAPGLPGFSFRLYGTEFDIFQAYGFDGGDSNLLRDQGQVLLKNNVIIDSSNFGIDIDAGNRNVSLSAPGASQPFTTNNPGDLIPGVVVVNNVIAGNNQGGVRLGGDTGANANAPNQFARIVNNTIVGGTTGILITESASPTLLNNVIASTNIAVDARGGGVTELFSTLYLGNNQDVLGNVTEAFPVDADALGGTVFSDLANRDFYPAALSLLIDNSVGAVNDRTALEGLRNSLGISDSPIIAPSRDLTNAPRNAAPNNNGGGTGNNVFIDIGALDRSDLVGPFANLIDPLDNSSIDSDTAESFVRLVDGNLDRFEIQIIDANGTGLDDSTVTAERINLTQNGRLLVEGVHYTFGYSATNNTIQLTPTSGVWDTSSAYEITLNNRLRVVTAAPSGDAIIDGEQFTITDNDGAVITFEYDTGYVLELSALPADGDKILYRTGNTVVQVEFNDTSLGADPMLAPASSQQIDFTPGESLDVLTARIGELFASLDSLGLTFARDIEGGRVYLGGVAGDQVSVVPATPTGTVPITVQGIAGTTPDTTPVNIIPSVVFTNETVAGRVMARIAESALDVPVFSPGGGVIYLENIDLSNTGQLGFVPIPGFASAIIAPIEDIAGNPLEPNRSNRETQFTILMPNVELDFGDATPGFYPTLLADNGARHTVGDPSLPRLGSVVDTELNGSASDDQIVGPITATGSAGIIESTVGNTISVLVASPTSTETLTIDVDGTERVFELVLVSTATSAANNIPVLIVPGESNESTAQRLALAIEDELANVNELVNIRYENNSASFTIESIDDEDGVFVGSIDVGGSLLEGIFLDEIGNPLGFLNPNSPAGTKALVETSGGGLLDVWVDFNADGDFTDPGEKVLSNIAMLDGLNPITIPQFNPPANLFGGSITQTKARFRLSASGNTLSDGVVIGGEIEDYNVLIAAADLPEPLDDSDTAGSTTLTTLEDSTDFEVTETFLLSNDDLASATNVTADVQRLPSNGVLTETVVGGQRGWSYVPELDFYGTDTFTYSLVGEVTVDGTVLPVRSSQVATVTITVSPVNDAPFAMDHAGFDVLEPVDNGTTQVNIPAGDLLVGTLPKVPLTPAQAANPGAALVAPWDETNQNLTVTEIGVRDANGNLNPVVPGVVTPVFIAGSAGFVNIGDVIVSQDPTGTFVSNVVFAPGPNYNEDNPAFADPNEYTFQYTLSDDGFTLMPDGTTLLPDGSVLDTDGTELLPPGSSLNPPPLTTTANVRVRVIAQNDSPVTQPDVVSSVNGNRIVEVDNLTSYQFPASDILQNDSAGPVSTTVPTFLGADDENMGPNAQVVELIISISPADVTSFPMGDPGAGVAVHDSATGTGFLMYSPTSVFARFATNPPAILPEGRAAEQLVAVRYDATLMTWQYSNNNQWIAFATTPGDRLLAEVDFDAGTVASLVGQGGNIDGIEQGFLVGERVTNPDFVANDPTNPFDFSAVGGSQFQLPNDPLFPLSFESYTNRETAQGGRIQFAAGNFVYTPEPDFYGIDQFSYLIRDVGGAGHVTRYDSGIVQIDVAPVNDPPRAGSPEFQVIEESTTTILGADLMTAAIAHQNAPLPIGAPWDESAQTLTLISLSAEDANGNSVTVDSTRAANDGAGTSYFVEHGTITNVVFSGTELQSFDYTPALNFNSDNPRIGSARNLELIEFTIIDNAIAVLPDGAGTAPVTPIAATGTVTIMVAPQNDAPTLGNDRIDPDSGSAWSTFAGHQGAAPVPTEGSANQFLIPLAFLAQNDFAGLPPLSADGTDDETVPGTFADQLVPNDQTQLTYSLTTNTSDLGANIEVVTVNGEQFILYTPDEDAFGVDTFVYQGTDSGINEAADGTRTLSPLSSTGTVSILVRPSNDVPVSVDRTLSGTEDLPLDFTASDLLGVGSPNPALPIVTDTNRNPLFNETEQSLSISAVIVNGTEYRSNAADIELPNGSLDLVFNGNEFVSGTYTPSLVDGQESSNNLNIAIDEFQYIVADSGSVAIPDSDTFYMEPSERIHTYVPQESIPYNASIALAPVNDAPVFTAPSVIDITERDDQGRPSVVLWATNILPGPATAIDEASQTVEFRLLNFTDPSSPASASDLFYQAPLVDPSTGEISFFPSIDQFGQTVIEVAASDSEHLLTDPNFTNPQVIRTITVNVQPLNDPPIENPAALNTMATNPANPDDDAYSVNGLGEITYVLQEINGNDVGQPTFYDIPVTNTAFLPSLTSGGYERPGLIDVFLAGPSNEIDTSTPRAAGGSQLLSLVDNYTTPVTTTRGGTLSAVRDNNGDVIALRYVPAAEYNEAVGGQDSFNYTVTDDGVSFVSGSLADDPRTVTGRVFLEIQPVNSRPSFDILSNPPEIIEDRGVQNVIGFASSIMAGPDGASDENGQSLLFHVIPTSFDPADMSQLFSQPPTITGSGTLIYQTAPNVFGNFEFDVVLCDDGVVDSILSPCTTGDVSGTVRGDTGQSIPRPFRLDVLPVNDAPVTSDGNAPPNAVLEEDSSIVLSIGDPNAGYDLLGAFQGGPANENVASDFNGTPLPAQTVSLSDIHSFPTTTLLGVPLTPIANGAGDITGYRYTPPENYAGADQLVYVIRDNGQSVPADGSLTPDDDFQFTTVTVAIDVMPINDAPVSNADGNTSALNVTVTEGDGVYTDPDWIVGAAAGPPNAIDELRDQQLLSPALTLISGQINFVSPPVAVLTDGSVSLSFEAEENAFGVAEYVVSLTDDGGTLGNAADDDTTEYTFTITVEGVNDPPTFDSPDSVTVPEDSGAYQEQLLTNISVGPSEPTQTIDRIDVVVPDALMPLFSQQPTISNDGILSFTPATDVAGVAELEIIATDSEGGQSTPITLTINVENHNDPPIAVDDSLSTGENEILQLNFSEILANDIDPDLNNLPVSDEVLNLGGIQGVSDQGATVSFNFSDRTVSYDPSSSAALDALTDGEFLVDRFTYTITDGEESSTATVELTVNGINDAPRVNDDDFNLVPDTAAELPILNNDSDADGELDPSSIVITRQPPNGAIELFEDGRLVYTPVPGFRGIDSFEYTVADQEGQQSVEAVVTLRVGVAPVTSTVTTGTSVNLPVDIDLLSSIPGQTDPGSVTVVTAPQNGTTEVLPSGEIRYTPNTDYMGDDFFVFTVADSAGFVSEPTRVNLSIVESNLQNPVMHMDVNASGTVTPLDALLIINRLAQPDASGGIVPVSATDRGPNYYDPTGDKQVTARDALSVINDLAAQSSGTGGEGELVAATIATPLSDTIDAPEAAIQESVTTPPTSIESATDKIVGSEVLVPVEPSFLDIITSDDGEEKETTVAAIDEAMLDLLG